MAVLTRNGIFFSGMQVNLTDEHFDMYPLAHQQALLETEIKFLPADCHMSMWLLRVLANEWDCPGNHHSDPGSALWSAERLNESAP